MWLALWRVAIVFDRVNYDNPVVPFVFVGDVWSTKSLDQAIEAHTIIIMIIMINQSIIQ